MSIFGKIMSAIFGTHAEAATPTATPEAGGGATSSSDAAAAGSDIDVAAILDKAVARKKEKLTWRTSIVDLMKALDIDSSQSARKELAKELKYSGDTNDSAAMNVWLHKQMMAQLAANGGKLPPDDAKSSPGSFLNARFTTDRRNHHFSRRPRLYGAGVSLFLLLGQQLYRRAHRMDLLRCRQLLADNLLAPFRGSLERC